MKRMSDHIVRSYLANVNAVRRFRENEMLKAIDSRNKNEIIRILMSDPSLINIKINGGSLLHRIFTLPIKSDEDEHRTYIIMTTLYAWGLDFNTLDKLGETPYSYIKTENLRLGYFELGGIRR